MHSFRNLTLALLALCAFSAKAQSQRVDLGVSFTAARSLKAASGQNFWMEGGSIELGTNVWKGFGIAANIGGVRTISIGTSGVSLSLVASTFGPRYRWHANHKLSIYGEGLVGEANGFNSTFPIPHGATDSSNSIATNVGGGVDLQLGRRIAIRALDASWLRTQLPNDTDNIQNTLQLGAGVVLCFGH